MEMFLTENDSVHTLNEIRVSPGAYVHNSTKDCVIRIDIEIDKYKNWWNFLHFELVNPPKNIDLSDSYTFSLYLSNPYNNDTLVIANTKTQEYNNSNMFEIVYFMLNSIWIPVANESITITEQQWLDLLPDTFKLVPLDSFDTINQQDIETRFEYVIRNNTLANKLHSQFFKDKQPIIINYNEFLNFCEQNNV